MNTKGLRRFFSKTITAHKNISIPFFFLALLPFQFSTGPTSDTGKAKSSLNAVDEAAVLSAPAVEEERNYDWEDPKKFGFEFKLEQIEVRAIELKPDLFDAWYAERPEELVA